MDRWRCGVLRCAVGCAAVTALVPVHFPWLFGLCPVWRAAVFPAVFFLLRRARARGIVVPAAAAPPAPTGRPPSAWQAPDCGRFRWSVLPTAGRARPTRIADDAVYAMQMLQREMGEAERAGLKTDDAVIEMLREMRNEDKEE